MGGRGGEGRERVGIYSAERTLKHHNRWRVSRERETVRLWCV